MKRATPTSNRRQRQEQETTANAPPRRRRVYRRRAVAAFTLVELLTVIVIISVLLTIAISTVQGLGGSKRRAAVGALMGVLDQARMRAISDGRATYVVFVSPSTAQASAAASLFPANAWGRAYAIFQDRDNINFKPAQLSGWQYLPTGVAFKRDNSGGGTACVTTEPLAAGDTTAFPIHALVSGATDRSIGLPYVKFDPTGSVVDFQGNLADPASPRLRVLIFEGAVTAAGSEVATRRIGGVDADKRLFEQIDLRPTTGRAKYVLDPANNLAAAASTH